MKRTYFDNLKFCSLVWMATLGSAAVGGTTNESLPTASSAATLDSLVSEALEKNPELKFYAAEIAAAKGERRTAGLPANPELSGSIGQKTARGGELNAEGAAWSVSVLQPFEWPGRIGLREAIANRDIELAELGYARFKVALAGRARALAYGLFAAQERAAVTREVAERFKALREVLVQRDPAGLAPLLETRIIEAAEVTMQRKADAATVAARAVLFDLNQLRGAAPEAPLSVTPTHLLFRPAGAGETLVALARTNNFELRFRAEKLTQQGLRVELARNERFPAISVGPTFSEERATERERIIGVGVSLPLPLWNRNVGGIEAAKARQMQAEVSLEVAAREIDREVIEAALTYEAKRQALARWRPDSVKHFREAAELADRHYRLGGVPVSTYVESQKQCLEAVEGLLDTKQEALDVAQQLELLTGLAPPLASTTTKKEQK